MSTPPSRRRNIRPIAVALGLLLVLGVLVAFGYLAFNAGNFVSDKINAETDMISSRSGLSPYLVKGIALIATIPLFQAYARLAKNWKGLLWMLGVSSDPLSTYRQTKDTTNGKEKNGRWDGLIVVAYTGAFSILMWWASRDAYAYRFCADMPDGSVVSSDHPGKEPRYGEPYHPCTREETNVALDAEGKLTAAKEIAMASRRRIQWFNPATGKPRVWYSQRSDGYHFFDHAGNDPDSGDPLQPVTVRVARAYEASRREAEQQAMSVHQRKQAEAQEQRQASQDIAAASQAQALFESHSYKGALEICERVLSHGPNDVCLQVKHDSSVQLAHTLVDQGQVELQRAEFDQAIRSATRAKQLDPENQPAQKLYEVASVMKRKASLD